MKYMTPRQYSGMNTLVTYGTLSEESAKLWNQTTLNSFVSRGYLKKSGSDVYRVTQQGIDEFQSMAQADYHRKNHEGPLGKKLLALVYRRRKAA